MMETRQGQISPGLNCNKIDGWCGCSNGAARREVFEWRDRPFRIQRQRSLSIAPRGVTVSLWQWERAASFMLFDRGGSFSAILRSRDEVAKTTGSQCADRQINFSF